MTTVAEALDAMAALDRAEAERERRRNNPTPAECAERIEALRAYYAGHIRNELMAVTFKRMIGAALSFYGDAMLWGMLHSRVGTHMPRTPIWFRAHEGTYPCVHAGVLVGFCSPEFATAFEALVSAGYLTVEIDGSMVDCYGVPDATVRFPPARLN